MVDDPDLVLTVDPDSRRSAYAVAVRKDEDAFTYCGSWGGGARAKPVAWQTITGQRKLLREVSERYGVPLERMLVVVETQPPDGPRSGDVERLRRVRYHFEAACELLKIPCSFVSISWAARFVPNARSLGPKAQKAAYMRKASALTHGATINEDQCAAFGMLAVEIESLDCELYIESPLT